MHTKSNKQNISKVPNFVLFLNQAEIIQCRKLEQSIIVLFWAHYISLWDEFN